MPYLRIQTNVSPRAGDVATVVKTLSAAVADMLGKSENYVMVALETDIVMTFAGSDAPAAYVELKSLNLPEDNTAAYSATLCERISAQLDVPPDRIYISFSSPARHLWGWNNKVF